MKRKKKEEKKRKKFQDPTLSERESLRI